MNFAARACWAASAAIAGALTLALIVPAAGAAPSCAAAIIQDWSDDGRVDDDYDLTCYEAAVEAIPADLRDYTNASEVIERALTAAVRANGGTAASKGQTETAAPTSDASTVPLLPLGGAVFALGMVLAGGAAYLARRRRAS